MAQALPTICAHNAQAFALLPNTPTRCRQCGTILYASTREINNGSWPTPYFTLVFDPGGAGVVFDPGGAGVLFPTPSPDRVIDSEKGVNATYPGQFDAASLSWPASA